ncbi:MAG: universal stress protein [Mizugakiibacter sp.]|uniref:universal stress protein n=1 Tax=Mizugakiibacter sp. TaxID=1972610 RepID=UPI0031BD8477|nr:universal stress protein [Xanthomonadaceae bacterium]
MRDILAYALRHDAWPNGLRFAAELAAMLEARLCGIFVNEPAAAIAAYDSAMLVAELLALAREEVEAARAAAAPFRAWASGHAVRGSEWIVAEGRVGDVLAYAGNWHDLLVLERDPDRPGGSVGVVGHAVLGTDLPCVVVPAAWAPPLRLEHVALAWNGSAESIRAIHGALPILRLAGRVTLLSGRRKEPLSALSWHPPFDVQRHLEAHGIGAGERPIEADDAEAGRALLDAAASVRADLLVMGAYGRTRFSEYVFGGATRQVLEHATLPVLMQH